MDRVKVQLHGPYGPQHARALLLQGRSVACALRRPAVLGDVDVLARLVLLARRRGLVVELPEAVAGLLALTGLSALRGGDPVRQPEAGEQRRVEEVVHVDQLAP